MLQSLLRVIKFGLQSFWRNVWLSVVTVTIITLGLLSVSLLAVSTVLSHEALSRLQNRIDISVYLKPELTDDQVKGANQAVEAIPGVKTVEVTTAAQALDSFKQRHQDNPTIAQSITELGTNPLGATLTVTAVNEAAYQQVLQGLQSPQLATYIQEARFEDYRKIIDAFTNLSSQVRQVGGAVSLVFILIALLVVFNAMRINIYTHREEIGIMRLVGGTSWFIRGPFLVESIVYALLATLITAAIFFPLLSFVQPYVDSFFDGYRFDLVGYFTSRSVLFFGLEFVGAALLNILASTVAMRRYLKV